MNTQNAYKALSQIALDMKNECETRLNNVDKSHSNERKAIQIELGMYGLCLRAGLLYYTTGSEESLFNTLESQSSRTMIAYDKIKEKYLSLTDGKQLFSIVVGREAFMRTQFYDAYINELALAEKSGSQEKAFEIKIKIGALNRIFTAWEEWRRENNIFPNMFR